MKCSKAKKLMFSYLDDKLSEEEKSEVTNHLKECPWCSSEYKKTQKMLKVINDVEPKMVPDGLHSDIMREINGLRSFREDEKREVSRALRKGVVRGGLVCVACFLAFFIIQFVDFDSIKKDGAGALLKIDEKIAQQKMMNTKTSELYDMAELEESKELDTSDFLGTGRASKKEEESSVMALANFEATITGSVNDESAIKEEVSYKTTAEKENNLGLLGTESYSTYLDDASITKKAALNMYVTNYNDAINKLDVVLGETNSEVYYKNVYYEINDGVESDYKTAVIAVKVPSGRFNELLTTVKELGTSDVEILQDAETNLEISPEDQLIEAKNIRTELVGKIETLRDENDEDGKNDEEIEDLKARVEDVENQIEDLEDEISNETKVELDKACKLEITFREISESELKGILSGSTWWSSIKLGTVKGAKGFVRFIQDAIIWICSNILYIIGVLILGGIIFTILKWLFDKDRE